jgi:hypothetical protein
MDRSDLVVPLRIRLEVGDNGRGGATSAATRPPRHTGLIKSLDQMQHVTSPGPCH